MSGADAVTVFIAATLTAVATGPRALPLLVPATSGRRVLGVANAAESGVMLAILIVGAMTVH